MSAGTVTREELDAAHAAAGTSPDPDGAGGDDGALFEDSEGQFVLRVGGQAPTTHKVRLYGGAIEVEPPEDGFVKGASYVLRVEVVCHRVGLTDQRDGKTGEIVGCSDERGLRITGVALA